MPALERRLSALLWVVLLVGSGCTVASGAFVHGQSHYAFPNSNVVPLGNATGEASKVSLFMPVIADGKMVQDAVQRAMRAKGGDLMIDYVEEQRTTAFLFLYVTTVTIRGTAAKMEVGVQGLEPVGSDR